MTDCQNHFFARRGEGMTLIGQKMVRFEVPAVLHHGRITCSRVEKTAHSVTRGSWLEFDICHHDPIPSFVRKMTGHDPRWSSGVSLRWNFDHNVTKFAPHEVPQFIAWGKLTFDERVGIHRVDWSRSPQSGTVSFFLFTNLKRRVEWYKSLWALNTSPPRNHCKFV